MAFVSLCLLRDESDVAPLSPVSITNGLKKIQEKEAKTISTFSFCLTRRLYSHLQRHEFETKNHARKKHSIPSENPSLQARLGLLRQQPTNYHSSCISWHNISRAMLQLRANPRKLPVVQEERNMFA